MNNISFNIQKILIENKITLTELADKLEISKQRISYILLTKDDKNWKLDNLKEISDALGLDFKEFVLRVVFNEN